MAQILQIQKKNDDLGSSGTKTPDTVPEISSENNPSGVSCNENSTKEEHIEKESNSSNTVDVDMIDAVSTNKRNGPIRPQFDPNSTPI